jgi:hypothetical protein
MLSLFMWVQSNDNAGVMRLRVLGILPWCLGFKPMVLVEFTAVQTNVAAGRAKTSGDTS